MAHKFRKPSAQTLNALKRDNAKTAESNRVARLQRDFSHLKNGVMQPPHDPRMDTMQKVGKNQFFHQRLQKTFKVTGKTRDRASAMSKAWTTRKAKYGQSGRGKKR